MKAKKNTPDYIFESSWEVCNKVGGIYTVLSTRAATLKSLFQDRIIFIGPNLENNCECFQECDDLFLSWRKDALSEGLSVRIGRWLINGAPLVILVDFKPFFNYKNEIYSQLWESHSVDSLHAYGDYDEASMFSYAAARVVESFLHHNTDGKCHAIYHCNEWMTGLGLLYINKKLPQVGTVFTTHATSIGRSIAGNMKPLYNYLFAYNGDQMAFELNMQSKHSVEKQSAWYSDCFSTVSNITSKECKELLGKQVDIVLPNGFDEGLVPSHTVLTKKRRQARKRLLQIANALVGKEFDDSTLIISTSGRYEFRNKGIDVFIDAMRLLNTCHELNKKVVAFIEVPAWVASPRTDLMERLHKNCTFDTPLPNPIITHNLHNTAEDRVLSMFNYNGIDNARYNKVSVIFLPCYLDGHDGILNMSYYDALTGNDLCVYPSYYEPWGYTPLEATAFNIPCITTDLSGFGLWAQSKIKCNDILQGVKIVHRTDYNYHDVVDAIKHTVAQYATYSLKEVAETRRNASRIAKQALWKHFIKYYEKAYNIALTKAQKRVSETQKE